eukprot:1985901-Prymnesium_polylepis.1
MRVAGAALRAGGRGGSHHARPRHRVAALLCRRHTRHPSVPSASNRSSQLDPTHQIHTKNIAIVEQPPVHDILLAERVEEGVEEAALATAFAGQAVADRSSLERASANDGVAHCARREPDAVGCVARGWGSRPSAHRSSAPPAT